MLNLIAHLTTQDDREPTTATQALKDPKWCQAMSEKYDTLVQNGT